MCRELAVEVKDKEKTEEVDDVESGEVISVCEFQLWLVFIILLSMSHSRIDPCMSTFKSCKVWLHIVKKTVN